MPPIRTCDSFCLCYRRLCPQRFQPWENPMKHSKHRKLLMLIALILVVACCFVMDSKGDSRSKNVKATYLEMGGLDKTRWIITIAAPECGISPYDSGYE